MQWITVAAALFSPFVDDIEPSAGKSARLPMSVDKQRIAAVAALEALGFAFSPGHGWLPPIGSVGARQPVRPDCAAEADAMHALLVMRADVLKSALQKETAAAELELITDAISAYEAKRWPHGKIPGGKG